jgi:hypothetical protein
MAGSALAVAILGLTPVIVAQEQSGAAPVVPSSGTSSAAAAADNPADVAAAPTEPTTTTKPVEITTATTGPAAATTTAPPVTSTTTTAAVASRSAVSVESTRMAQVEAIADSSGFDWRAAGVTFHVAYHPEACCHWGIYDYRDDSLWIGPSAFASSARLRYVVLHELAHAWQWATGRLGRLAADMASWGYSGNDALEYGADCVATVWGARTDNYWSCPAAAQALVSRRLAGDWS